MLIVRLSAIGDAIHALPVLSSLKQIAPDLAVDWVADRGVRALLAGDTRIREVIEFPRRERSSGLAGVASLFARARALIGRMRGAGYTFSFDLQGLLKSGIVAWFSGAASRVGFDFRVAREWPASLALSRRVAPPTGARHVIHKNLSLVREAFPGSRLETAAGLRVDPVADRRLGAFFEEASRTEERFGPRVLLVPAAGWRNKSWPAEQFGRLAALLAADSRGLQTFVAWGPGEEPLRDLVVAGGGRGVRALPETSLVELAAAVARADVVIAGDTGALHMAAALGRPVVALFGPTDPMRNGPLGTRAVLFSNGARCAPCWRRRCGPRVCMISIRPEAVFRAALDLLPPAPGRSFSA